MIHPQIEATLRELSSDQRDRIRTTGDEYISFSVSVFNAGSVVYIDTLSDIPESYLEPDSEEYGPHDFILTTEEARRSLDELSL